MINLVLLLCSILLILVLLKEIKLRKITKNIDNVPISTSNRIRFVKLQKEYLDKIQLPEILELNSFIHEYYLKRSKNEKNI